MQVEKSLDNTTFELVIDCLVKVLWELDGEITRTSSLTVDLYCDSLDLLEIGTELEDTFDIRLTEKVILGWHTVQDIVDTIVSIETTKV